jgi:hypothetical protein
MFTSAAERVSHAFNCRFDVQRGVIGQGLCAGRRGLARDVEANDLLAATLYVHLELHFGAADGARRWAALEPRAANDSIQSFVTQFRESATDERLEHAAALGTMLAAQLEDIDVVGCESNAERDVERRLREIADVYALVADATPDQLGAIEVQALARQHEASFEIHVGIAQIGRHEQVVAVYGRAQQHGATAHQRQREP